MLQSIEADGSDLNNGMMASMAQHDFWLQVMHLMLRRAPSVSSAWLRDGDKILESTGPEALRDAFVTAFQPGQHMPGEYLKNGSRVRVYGLGQWFQPCPCGDQTCMARADQQHQAKAADLDFVGQHKCMASWLTELKARNRLGTLLAVSLGLAMLASSLALFWHFKFRGQWRSMWTLARRLGL